MGQQGRARVLLACHEGHVTSAMRGAGGRFQLGAVRDADEDQVEEELVGARVQLVLHVAPHEARVRRLVELHRGVVVVEAAEAARRVHHVLVPGLGAPAGPEQVVRPEAPECARGVEAEEEEDPPSPLADFGMLQRLDLREALQRLCRDLLHPALLGPPGSALLLGLDDLHILRDFRGHLLNHRDIVGGTPTAIVVAVGRHSPAMSQR